MIKIKNLHFQYPAKSSMALSGINLQVEEGEFVVICGPSGCGKSTLLRLLKHETQPFGKMEGEIYYNQILLQDLDPLEAVRHMAMVWQDPENQIVMEQVQEELIFALENIGYSTDIMRKRLAEMVQFFGLETWLSRKTMELSGGQKQIINLASVLLLQPKVLLLDEPTAQLDPVSGKEFIQVLKRINEEFGMTIVLVEHRLEDVFSVADRVIMMEEGSIRYVGTPQDVTEKIWRSKDHHFLSYIPSITRVYLQMENTPQAIEIPFSVKDGRKWLAKKRIKRVEESQKPQQQERQSVLQVRDLDFRYVKDSPSILNGLDLDVYKSDFLAIVGGNGSGKSTLLQIMGGLLKPQSGKVLLGGIKMGKLNKQELYRRVAYLPQNPLTYFTYDTVEQELEYAANRFSSHALLETMIQDLGIESLLQNHPHDCSGGERQKVSLACLLLGQPEIILLDEPTKGMDPVSQQAFAKLLGELHHQGLIIVMVTHHIEFAARYANRCAMLFDGIMTAEGDPSSFFSGNFFYTTHLNRMSRDWFPTALTEEEVIKRWPVPNLSSFPS
ncbi:ABC transporter ATP-binding protein [Ammoniphilus sp. 3BR4]|uniref:ABC transporter ATP-binding protein n=1 Tax=Ammoniphilus sp. 3BR4 TaxID=3158265 RepID=UPI003466690C